MGALWIIGIAFEIVGVILIGIAAETNSQDIALLAVVFTFIGALCVMVAGRRDRGNRAKIHVICMKCGAQTDIDPMNGPSWCECETKEVEGNNANS